MDYNTAAEHGFLVIRDGKATGEVAGFNSNAENVKKDANRVANSNNSSSAKATALQNMSDVTGVDVTGVNGTDVTNYISSLPNTDLSSANSVLNYAMVNMLHSLILMIGLSHR